MATWKLPPLPPKPPAVPHVAPQDTHVEIEGEDTLQARLSMLPQVIIGSMLNDLLQQAELVMDDSKENYCPFKFGILRASGEVYVEDNTDEIILRYGAPGSGAEVYALEQHENLSYHHSIGQAKYLEVPVALHSQALIAVAGQSMQSTLEKISTGWASGDWKTVVPIRNRPNGKIIQGYTTKGGRKVKTHFRSNRNK